MEYQKNKIVKSPLNYSGGKHKLLPQILPLFPEKVNRFIDMFSGGSNVGVNVNANKIICNDIEGNVISLMKYFSKNDYQYIEEQIEHLINKYSLSDTYKHSYEHYGCNSSDGVAKVNKEGYKQLREAYNKGEKTDIMFYTMLIYAFNNQIRFNSKGDFNMPVNKRDFNGTLRKNLKNFVDRLKEINITFTNGDFKNIKVNKLKDGDFIYCDPPYLISTATYNEQGGWTKEDDEKLFKLLDEINEGDKQFALSNVVIHKGKQNEGLVKWSEKYNVHILDKNYKNCNYHTKDRTDNATVEVLITNY